MRTEPCVSIIPEICIRNTTSSRKTVSGGWNINANELPWALGHRSQIIEKINERAPAFFLDFDGTLAPIASRPDMVVLPDQCRQVLTELSNQHLVCIISGRDLDDLMERTAVPNVYYAGDHGYRIVGPPGSNLEHEVGTAAREELAAAAEYARELLTGVDGVLVEGKALSVSVHYRLVPPESHPAVAEAVGRISQKFPELRQTGGKMVFEFHPAQDWNKGAAMLWLLGHLGYDRQTACPVCLGDDETDENTFKASQGWGVSIIVSPVARPTYAGYMLRDTQETATFLAASI